MNHSYYKKRWLLILLLLVSTQAHAYIGPGAGFAVMGSFLAIFSAVLAGMLAVFTWAQHRKHKNGVKLHTPMDLKGSIPFFKEQLFLYYQSKKEYSLLSQVFLSDRQKHWFKKRSGNKADRSQNFARKQGFCKALISTSE